MPEPAVSTILYMVDEAWEGLEEHALQANLRSLDRDDWLWEGEGAGRTILSIAEHVAVAKHVWTEHLFGAAERDYDAVHATSPLRASPEDIDALLAWLGDAQIAYRAGVASLRDAQLGEDRSTHWGGRRNLRRSLESMLAHDIYHAGEINHIRALHRGDDGWPWQGAT